MQTISLNYPILKEEEEEEEEEERKKKEERKKERKMKKTRVGWRGGVSELPLTTGVCSGPDRETPVAAPRGLPADPVRGQGSTAAVPLTSLASLDRGGGGGGGGGGQITVVMSWKGRGFVHHAAASVNVLPVKELSVLVECPPPPHPSVSISLAPPLLSLSLSPSPPPPFCLCLSRPEVTRCAVHRPFKYNW